VGVDLRAGGRSTGTPSQVQVQGHGASEDVCSSRQRQSVGSTMMRDRFCLGQCTLAGAGGEEASVELEG